MAPSLWKALSLLVSGFFLDACLADPTPGSLGPGSTTDNGSSIANGTAPIYFTLAWSNESMPTNASLLDYLVTTSNRTSLSLLTPTNASVSGDDSSSGFYRLLWNYGLPPPLAGSADESSNATGPNGTASLRASSQENSTRPAAASSTARNASIVMDVNYQLPRLAPDGLRYLGGHLALHIAGTDTDGPLHIEMVRSDVLALRVSDWTVANSKQMLSTNNTAGCNRIIYDAGPLFYSNAELLDPATGDGLIADTYRAQPGYLSGQRSGLHFVQALALNAGLELDQDFHAAFKLLEQYEQQPPLIVQKTLPLLLQTIPVWGDASQIRTTIFDTTDLQHFKQIGQNLSSNDNSTSQWFPDTSDPPATLAHWRSPLPLPWIHDQSRAGATLGRRATGFSLPQVPPSDPSFGSTDDSWRAAFKLYNPFLVHAPTDADLPPGEPPNSAAESQSSAGGRAPAAPRPLQAPAEPVNAGPGPWQRPNHRLKVYIEADRYGPDGVPKAINIEIYVDITNPGAPGPNQPNNYYVRRTRINPSPRFLNTIDAAEALAAMEQQAISGEEEIAASTLKDLKRAASRGPASADNDRAYKRPRAGQFRGSYDEREPTWPADRGNGRGPARSGRGSCLRSLDRRCSFGSDEGAGLFESKQIALTKMAGAFSTVDLLDSAKFAAGAAGAAVTAFAAAIVIVDFVNGDVVGGVVGLAGLVASTLAVALAGGPVGLLLGGLISLVSVALLASRSPTSSPPDAGRNSSDTAAIQQIIQYKMFGDKDHTGNENCRKGTSDHPGNPNCVAVYGAGVIGSAFGWDNFDPVAFLMHYNDGYPMSIPDMASAFYRKDINDPDSDGANQIATITCDQTMPCGANDACYAPSTPDCGNSKFELKRELINFPLFNQTADQVYKRLLPQPGGDCKIVSDPSAYHYSAYNLTITGAAAAIACNLTGDINVAGTSNLVSDTSAVNAPKPGTAGLAATAATNGSAPGNVTRPGVVMAAASGSTDGQSHYVAAPAAQGFANLTNVLCLGSATANLCLPNGTYDAQTGGLGFDGSSATSLSIPAGAVMSMTIVDKVYGLWDGDTYSDRSYNTNQTSDDHQFAEDMQQLSKTVLPTFNVDIPGPAPAAVCLFSQPSFKGDAACFGVGAGDLPAKVQNQAQSLRLYGGVSAWLYAQAYNDRGDVEVGVDIADLSDEKYGPDGNFNKKIKALWVVHH